MTLVPESRRAFSLYKLLLLVMILTLIMGKCCEICSGDLKMTFGFMVVMLYKDWVKNF